MDFSRFNTTNYRWRAFSFASPYVWNSLSVYLRSTVTITAFKRSLRTFSIPADNAFSAVETILLFSKLYQCFHHHHCELCENANNSVRTRPSARGDFKIQRTRTKFGERAFAVAGPATWNSLPFKIRNSVTLNSFKTALKPFMFSLEYWLF